MAYTIVQAVVEGSKDEEGSEGSEGKNVDYTPLSNETNYVKVGHLGDNNITAKLLLLSYF